MAIVIKSYSTTCQSDLLDAINANSIITTQCVQIIDPQTTDLWFDFISTISGVEDIELDSILTGWSCPIYPVNDDPDGSTVINDSLGPNDDVMWTSDKVNSEILSSTIFGSEYNYSESLSVTTTNATVYVPKLKLTTTSLPNGTYRVGWSYSYNHNANTNDFLGRIQLNDSNTITLLRVEPKDSAGSFGSTGTNQRYSASGFINLTLSGINELDIDFASSSSGTTSGIWDARLELWRIS